ncbi:MAG: peptidylprolyl isomerase, partial [Cyclobacteriaceae bacterium]
MALINKIREKTGLAVGVIAFGLILFLVGGDLLGPNSVLLGQDKNSVGEIAGEEIDYLEFNSRVEQFSQNGRIPANQMPFYRDQIWNDLVREISYGKKVDEVGIYLPNNELEEIVKGSNTSPVIRQNFTDPQTRQFEKQNVLNFLSQYNDLPAEQRAAWDQLEQQVKTYRLIEKYQNLILKTSYVTTAEAKMDYRAKNATASVSYLYVPFLSIPDSVANVTDAELKSYISSHKDEYDVPESRNISYVEFKVDPSGLDSAARKKEINELIVELKNTTKDSLFAKRNSEALTPYRTVRREDLPQDLKSIETLNIGDVYGPFLRGNSYVAYKVSQLSDKYSARASHILIQPENDTDEANAAAKKKAEDIIREIRNGADFAEKAREHGTDGTASKGGDLGWFTEGAMVAEFNDAVMNASKTGLIRKPVKTQFGYHIIDVTETKVQDSYKIAQLEKEIYPSDETTNQFYRNAENFAASVKDEKEFIAKAKEAGLKVLEKKGITQNESRINSLNEARSIVAWAFRDGEKGSISEVYDLDNKYVVAVVTGVQEKGIAKLETVRNEVERKVINEKKAEYIKNKLGTPSGSLEDIAASFGDLAKVYSMDGLKLSANSLNNVGAAPEAIGLAFALNEG